MMHVEKDTQRTSAIMGVVFNANVKLKCEKKKFVLKYLHI